MSYLRCSARNLVFGHTQAGLNGVKILKKSEMSYLKCSVRNLIFGHTQADLNHPCLRQPKKAQKTDNKIYIWKIPKTVLSKLYHVEDSKTKQQTV